MKKFLVGIAIFAALAVLAGLVYFLVVLKKTTPTSDQLAGNSFAPEIKSFRGVLADVLDDIKKEAEKIEEAVSNPFSGDKNKTAENFGDNGFTFAILGDTQRFTAGNSKGNFQKAVARIKEKNPDLVIATGDLVSNCKGKSDNNRDYANWKNILGPLAEKTYAVQGNHDRVENMDECDQFWADAFSFPINGPSGFTEFAYSLDLKNSHFVFLDSDKPDEHKINSTQRDWLERDLAATKKENTFVFFHEPAYPVSSKMTESLDFDPAERNALWRILEKHNVKAVFNGHEHIVSRRKIGGVYQFVFGNTDSFNHDLPVAGVAEYANQGQGRFGLVKVNGKAITVETHGPDGALLNTFTLAPQ
ncbi:MAG: hypothetical protein A2359_03480 [Candidatus Moranbacteria bacterium RIFOXYB1_FULL_43_19]|nr:MAG: hypothetical protein A2359_03480 [Candidatus Moranbacteria bacterium RIFOXYB1_FULL_43_19]OGI32528.1 MAG: hypothetical protein A2420_03055 [Candidatus Moranbacteria bacterium RIFOXYC1_FULL_44_13]OGI38150.1 MAG: hypothetical protein A2612_01345 [Candidatus Moranbacteria bacterium RIFOXYD1_FULL_44_12]